MSTFPGARIVAIWDARISDLRDGETVSVTCLRPSCRHEAIIPAETIKTVLGERVNRPVDHLPRFLRCTGCGDHKEPIPKRGQAGRGGGGQAKDRFPAPVLGWAPWIEGIRRSARYVSSASAVRAEGASGDRVKIG